MTGTLGTSTDLQRRCLGFCVLELNIWGDALDSGYYYWPLGEISRPLGTSTDLFEDDWDSGAYY